MWIPIYEAVLSLATACHCIGFLIMYRRRTFLKGLPQPPSSFLWGHLKILGEAAANLSPNCHPQLYMTLIAQKYNFKGLFYLDLWPLAPPHAAILDPVLMNKVMALPIHKVSDDFMTPITGPNVISAANGRLWKKAHRAMAPAFALQHVRAMTGIMIEEVLLFRKILHSFAESGEIFSLEQALSRLIFDVITRLTFNFCLDAQTRGSDTLDDLRGLIQLGNDQFSWNLLKKIKNWWRRKPLVNRVNKLIENKITERLDLLKRDGIVPSKRQPYSILDLMLREETQIDTKPVEERGAVQISRADMDLLITNIKALLIGGSGTTTDTLCFAYLLLSKHPDVLQKLQEEHDRVFDTNLERTVSILQESPQQLSELVYTRAVIKETLRMFPIGYNPRAGLPDSTLNYEGRTYPLADMVVFTPPHTLHYDPEFYEKPKEFRPERFLDSSGADDLDLTDRNSKTTGDSIPRVPASHFRTFGRGPRACSGQTLAMEEMKLILLLTVREFSFEGANVIPNASPRAPYSYLDTVLGDVIFQEFGLEARPRGSVPIRIRKTQSSKERLS